MRSLAAQAGAATVLIGGGPSGDLQDPVQGAGPVGSLCALAEYAAALSAPRRWVIVPVDMPLLTPALLGGLVSVPAPAAAFRDHPLPLALTVDENACAVFVEARARLAAGESVAVWQVLAWLKGQQLSPADTDIAQLINVNTLDEWSRLNDRA